jgi:hypothetical protein
MSLAPEFKYYLANKEDFAAKYAGKFIVIKDQDVIGVYEDQLEAIKKTQQEHKLGTFLVQQVTPLADQARFHSRATL